MKINDRRRTELEVNLPSAAATRQRLVDHMRGLDLPLPQFAHFVGYSATALRAFLNDRYHEQRGTTSDLLIREALETYLRTNALAADTHAQAKLYETENVLQMREWFTRCQQHGYMTVIYGPPGSQKTFVAERLVADFNRAELDRKGSSDRAYMVRCSIGIRPCDLMAKICRELGLPRVATLQRCLTSIRLALRNRRVLLVIDECQLAGIPALEALRELHDSDGVGLLLLGSHALRQFFDTRAAELEQFNSRIEDMVELTGVTEASARTIMAAELPDLSRAVAESAIGDAFVPDIYSRVKGKKYCSVRRLFKSIAAYREIQAESLSATNEVIQ